MAPVAKWIELHMSQVTKLLRRRTDPRRTRWSRSQLSDEWESYVGRFAYPARREVRRLMRSSSRLVDLAVVFPGAMYALAHAARRAGSAREALALIEDGARTESGGARARAAAVAAPPAARSLPESRSTPAAGERELRAPRRQPSSRRARRTAPSGCSRSPSAPRPATRTSRCGSPISRSSASPASPSSCSACSPPTPGIRAPRRRARTRSSSCRGARRSPSTRRCARPRAGSTACASCCSSAPA